MERPSLLLLAVVGTGAFPVAAQTRQFASIQASGVIMTLSGRSGSQGQFGWNSGFGGEAQFRINPPGQFSIGAGVQFTSHGGSNPNFPNDRNKVSGFFLEPRYAIKVNSSKLRPYVAGRVASLKQSLTLEGLAGQSDLKWSATAVGVGGGAGFIVRLGPSANFDLGAAFMTADFGKNYVDAAGVNVPGEAPGNGSPFLLKAGINIGLGK